MMRIQTCSACSWAATIPVNTERRETCPNCGRDSTVEEVEGGVEELAGANDPVTVRWSLLFRMTLFTTTALQCIQNESRETSEILATVEAGRELLSELNAVSMIERMKL